MEDNPIKPVPKPPGYRDPDAPPPPPPPPPITDTPQQQQPMRKPAAMPPTFIPKRKRKSCCRFCCICFCITIVLLIFLLLVATAIFYLYFDPKLPSFALTSFRLDNFKLTNSNSQISANTIARVEMKNPNSKLVFFYGNTNVEMSVGSGKDETRMGKTSVDGFKQGPKNSKSVELKTIVKNQKVESSGLGKRLAAKFESKDLVINVVAKTKVGLGVGGIKIGMLAVNLRCGGVSMNKLNTQSPKCTLNTLQWVNLQ